jgi:5-hydroxyisourate hydrolase-like protein (transthyretin family)
MSDHITVTFALHEASNVNISLVNIQGQTVKTFTSESLGAGNFRHSYDVNDLAAGLYLVKVQIGDNYAASKVVKE